MKIYLTGAAGMIGRSVYGASRDRGWIVHGCDLQVPRRKMENVIELDLRRPLPPDFLKGYDAVIHLAGYPDLGRAPDARLFADNIAISENVFSTAVASGVNKIIFSSSMQVFNGRENYTSGFRPGVPYYLPLDENLPENAANAYAKSKLAAEQSLRKISEQREISVVVLRFPWVLAPKIFFHATRRTVAASTRAEAFSFIELDDAASVIVAACERSAPGFHCYFPAARENLLFAPAKQVLEEYFARVPLKSKIETLNNLVDLSSLKRDLHWQPRPTPTWKAAVVKTRNFLSGLRQRWGGRFFSGG